MQDRGSHAGSIDDDTSWPISDSPSVVLMSVEGPTALGTIGMGTGGGVGVRSRGGSTERGVRPLLGSHLALDKANPVL